MMLKVLGSKNLETNLCFSAQTKYFFLRDKNINIEIIERFPWKHMYNSIWKDVIKFRCT